jgi:hypothetical protein
MLFWAINEITELVSGMPEPQFRDESSWMRESGLVQGSSGSVKCLRLALLLHRPAQFLKPNQDGAAWQQSVLSGRWFSCLGSNWTLHLLPSWPIFFILRKIKGGMSVHPPVLLSAYPYSTLISYFSACVFLLVCLFILAGVFILVRLSAYPSIVPVYLCVLILVSLFILVRLLILVCQSDYLCSYVCSSLIVWLLIFVRLFIFVRLIAYTCSSVCLSLFAQLLIPVNLSVYPYSFVRPCISVSLSLIVCLSLFLCLFILPKYFTLMRSSCCLSPLQSDLLLEAVWYRPILLTCVCAVSPFWVFSAIRTEIRHLFISRILLVSISPIS